MNSWRQFGVALILIPACAFCHGWSTAQPAQSSGTLETARAAHSLEPAQAARHLPVHLRSAVVTYYDPYIDARHGAMFVHDPTGSIFLRVPARPVLPVHPGSLVEIRGVTGAGDYAPIIVNADIKVVGESHLPERAPAVTMAELLSGAQDGQWVEVEGVVRSVRASQTNAFLELATAGGLLTATTRLEPGDAYDRMVDSVVRIHGNAGPVFNKKLQMVGVHLFFPSAREVKVIQPGSADPFSLPEMPVSRLLMYSPSLTLAHRVRVAGNVTLHWPGRLLCIQQNAEALCVDSPQVEKAGVGEAVTVVGFPAISGYKVTLDTPIFRRVAAPPPSSVQAQPVSAERAFRGDLDGALVRIDAQLIGQERDGNDVALLLQSGRFVFTATLPSQAGHGGELSFKNSSLLRLTGICRVQVDSVETNQSEGEIRPRSIQVLLRAADDVEVLRAPSWWTPEHALTILAGAAALSFAAFIWIVVLRRRVAQQTQALRASEERLRYLSHHDALTGLPNRLLLNDRLALAMNRADRFRDHLGVLMIDLDEFKAVNDRYGHQTGDQLLCEMGRRLSRTVRRIDTVARIGGDEFVILICDLQSLKDAELVAAKIVEAVSLPVDIGQMHESVSVSVGVCAYPEGGRDAEELLRNADSAMYRAKMQGKNSFQVFEPQPH
jgi:diguanylate cyclase (GGDEF)-like protein